MTALTPRTATNRHNTPGLAPTAPTAGWTTLTDASNTIALGTKRPEDVMLIIEIGQVDGNDDDEITVTIDGNPDLYAASNGTDPATSALLLNVAMRYLFGPFDSSRYMLTPATLAFHFSRPPVDTGTRAIVVHCPR